MSGGPQPDASVPPAVSQHLDDAAERLEALAKTEGLTFARYELSVPERKSWGHRIYGKARERAFYLAVSMRQADADKTTMLVQAYAAHYYGSQACWFPIGWRTAHNAFTMMLGIRDLLDTTRLACLLGMPHPTDSDPDPKA